MAASVILAFTSAMMEALPIGGEPQGRMIFLRLSPDSSTELFEHLSPVYFGAALGLIFHLRSDILRFCVGLTHVLRGRIDAEARLFFLVFALSAPCVLFLSGKGYVVLYSALSSLKLLSPVILELVGLVSAALLIAADRWFMTVKRTVHLGFKSGIFLGIVHMLGLFPGIGTVTALIIGTRFIGMERNEGFRLALLVWIPVLFAFGMLSDTVRFSPLGDGSGMDAFALIDIFSFVGATFFFFLAAFLGQRLIDWRGLWPFALFRIALCFLTAVLFSL
ncbi:hypothetical protein FACS1894205_5550 [Alphaproteobacteria bacterium]|nr:hypothetical protein FACS1894205_5550 [Alphaproteobacteria bacterium]